MRHVVIVMAILATPVAGFAQGTDSETALRAIVAEQAAAWNAGDGAGYSARVAPDASFTNIFGMVMYGAPAFANATARSCPPSSKGPRRRMSFAGSEW